MQPPPKLVSARKDLTGLQTEDLLSRARKGEEQAWEAIFARYRTVLVLAVRSRLGSDVLRKFDAEDVVQSGFLSAWEQIRNFEYRGEGSFLSWLRLIVVNRVLDLLRVQQREGQVLSPKKRQALGSDIADDSDLQPSALAAQHEEEAELIRALLMLPADEREVIVLRVFERRKWADVATMLEASTGQVRRRYQTGWERLNRSLAHKV